MHTLPLMALGGAFAGLIGSMLGLGGGFIVVPMLSILFRVPMHAAIATGQVTVMATSSIAAAAYLRARLTHVRLGIVLEIPTTIGAISGAFVGTRLPGPALAVVFGLLFLYVGWRMLRGSQGIDDPSITVETCRIRSWPAGLAGSYVGGVLSGLLGVGGGVVKVPIMCLGMGVPLRIATATSTFMVGITAAAGAFVYYTEGHLDLLVGGATVIGVAVGAALGPRVASRVHTRYLRYGFVVVAAYTAAVMIYKNLPAVLGYLGV